MTALDNLTQSLLVSSNTPECEKGLVIICDSSTQDVKPLRLLNALL